MKSANHDKVLPKLCYAADALDVAHVIRVNEICVFVCVADVGTCFHPRILVP